MGALSLRRFSFANFKAFKGRVDIPLGRITLIYGPNSAGKSSIFQALRLYIQSSRSESPKNPASGYVPRLHPTGDWIDASTITHVTHAQREGLPLDFSIEASDRRRTLEFSTSFSRGSLSQIGYRLLKGRETLVDVLYERRGAGDALKWVEMRGEPGLKSYLQVLGAPRRSIPSRFQFQMTGFEHLHLESELRGLSPRGQRNLACALCDIGGEVWGAVASVVFVAPIREQAARTPKSVLDDPELDWLGERGERLLDVLANEPTRVEKLNAALRQLEIPYTCSIERPGRGSAFERLAVLALKSSTVRGRGGRVYTPDVGFGVGQVMPMLVGGLSGGGRVICVEQPELHLHPRLQGHLADFVIETSMPSAREGQRWVLETHSEAMMLRLQRRIREGVISPEDVSVLYVEPHREGYSSIKRLELASSGHFLDPWPNGFFEERIQELR